MKQCPRCGRTFIADMPMCPDCPPEGSGPSPPGAMPGPMPSFSTGAPSPGGPPPVYGMPQPRMGPPGTGGGARSPDALPDIAVYCGFQAQMIADVRDAAATHAKKAPVIGIRYSDRADVPTTSSDEVVIPFWWTLNPDITRFFLNYADDDDERAQQLYYSIAGSLFCMRDMLHAARLNVREEEYGPVYKDLGRTLMEGAVAYLSVEVPFDHSGLQAIVERLVHIGIALGYPNDPSNALLPRTPEQAKDRAGLVFQTRLLWALQVMKSGRVRPFRELVKTIIQFPSPQPPGEQAPGRTADIVADQDICAETGPRSLTPAQKLKVRRIWMEIMRLPSDQRAQKMREFREAIRKMV
jgi:hypothetical protein